MHYLCIRLFFVFLASWHPPRRGMNPDCGSVFGKEGIRIALIAGAYCGFLQTLAGPALCLCRAFPGRQRSRNGAVTESGSGESQVERSTEEFCLWIEGDIPRS
jgi:hypothetical protein